jgi:Tfp pilus assembly protein PilX
MRLKRDDDAGFVLFAAVGLMVIMLALGFALLAVVDVQGRAAQQESADNTSFNAAEGVARSTAASVAGGRLYWPASASQTVKGDDTKSCGDASQKYTASTGTPLGKSLAGVVAQAYGSTAGTWNVSVCAVAAVGEAWSTAVLTRPAHATTYAGSASPIPAADPSNYLWIRAQSTAGGATRAVVLKVYTRQIAQPLPQTHALITGAVANDVVTTTGTLLSAPLVGSLTKSLLGSGGLFMDTAAKIGVRCGVLSVLNSGQLCVSGTLAGVTGVSSVVAGESLNGLLTATGINRFTDEKSYQVLTDDQIAAYKAEADRTGTHYAAVTNGAACFAGDAPGKVVYIDKVGSGGTDKCVLQLNAGTTRHAMMIIVEQGGVRVMGTGVASATPTVQSVLYVLNRNSDGKVARGAPGREMVRIDQGGSVDGAVFVDGSGITKVIPPPVSISKATCQSLLGLLSLTCSLANLTDSLLGLLSLDQLLTALLPQLSSYTAITRNTAVLAAGSSYTPAGAYPAVDGFRQIPSH